MDPERGKRVSEASIVAIAAVLQLSLEEIVLQEMETPDNTPLAEAERLIQEAIARSYKSDPRKNRRCLIEL